MSNLVYLSIGSNINPEKNIEQAICLLAQKTNIIAISTFWETAPIGLKEQPNFINGAVIVATDLSVTVFKEIILDKIEIALKRKRQVNKNAPRTIDIDIMLFNDEQLKLGHRSIPDAEILERDFVAIPLAEIAPRYIHPLTGQTLSDIARKFEFKSSLLKKRTDLTRLIQIQVAEYDKNKGPSPHQPPL